MYKIPLKIRTTIAVNDSIEGETIETKIARLLSNKDSTTDGKELIYTRAQDGIVSAFNIRHDHWDDAYEQSSIMAEKRTEYDAATLKKRKDLLDQKAREDKILRDNAREQLKNTGKKPGEE